MQRISRAPELSATRNLDSCWITEPTSLRLLEDLDQAPALRPRERAGLHHPDQIAVSGLVACVVGVQGAGAAHDLLVLRMPPGDLDLHGDRLVGLAGHDPALPHLATGGAALGRRGAGAPLLLLPALGTVGGAPADRLLARLAARPGALLGTLLWALLGGLARALQAPAGLPVESFELLIAKIRRSVRGRLLLLLLRRSRLGRCFLRLRLLRGGSLLGLGSLLLGPGSLLLSLLFRLLVVLLFLCHQALSSRSR